MTNTFRFTEETLIKFDSVFTFLGNAEPGVWLYQNPFKTKDDKGGLFLVQVGNGGVRYIAGWEPTGLTIDQIIAKLSK